MAGGQISIANEKEVFGLIYRIQEEVHRFTVSKMSGAKRRTVRKSVLEGIKGIGPSKARSILKTFGGLPAVRKASVEELETVKGISHADAVSVYNYFNGSLADEGYNR